MKNIGLLLITLLWALQGRSQERSSSYNISVWPSTPVIGQQPVFVLETGEGGKRVLEGLNTKYPIYLRSHSGKVRLQVREICVGAHKSMQVVLGPEKSLKAGVRYRMVIKYLRRTLMSLGQLDTAWKVIPPSWTVNNDAVPGDMLKWVIQPRVSKKVHVFHPLIADGRRMDHAYHSKHVYFAYGLATKNKVLFKVSVQQVGTEVKASYYVRPDSSEIRLHYSKLAMLGGRFNLVDSVAYEATFDVLEAQGRSLPWQGAPISFDTKWNKIERRELHVTTG